MNVGTLAQKTVKWLIIGFFVFLVITVPGIAEQARDFLGLVFGTLWNWLGTAVRFVADLFPEGTSTPPTTPTPTTVSVVTTTTLG
jgi:hypothetical protein